jgi:hypothetical protein
MLTRMQEESQESAVRGRDEEVSYLLQYYTSNNRHDTERNKNQVIDLGCFHEGILLFLYSFHNGPLRTALEVLYIFHGVIYILVFCLKTMATGKNQRIKKTITERTGHWCKKRKGA